MAVDVYFASAEIVKLVKDGCDDAKFDGDCTHKIIYSAVYFPVNAICLFVASVFIWILFWNMKIEYGDFIEKLLVQSRDIEELVQQARNGSNKEKRIAAFELATLAATSDDNKFKIVANDGLDILTQLALSRDESTREQAVEAINEMIMIPSIQESFIEKGGITTMSALLRTNNSRLVANASSAIQIIVSETDENKVAFADRQGLQDLAYAAKRATISTQRLIAAIFLELSIHRVVRNKMTTTNQLFEALEELAQSNDPQIQRNALQTLEILAMENSDRICEREQLLFMLLDIPSLTVDEIVYQLTSRILLYYAQNPLTCESMLNHPRFKETMTVFAKTKEVGLQRSTIRIINFTFELPHLKEKAQSIRIEDTLNVLKKHFAEREIWDLADESLRYLNEETTLSRIPNMTSKEKIARMDFNEFGSKASLRSGPSSS
ncbi:DgyrCDS4444 [Dimorphilus gyrociliatus]|uniref:DgyrCDS4444 n=1 Tax=Dimorphilus gyrociliatus TaxID=2664684 RepID=A0A7I8VIH1_9ANNE|nr:DgyrCDS4444 [Dimorphilus gyrociliatus]